MYCCDRFACILVFVISLVFGRKMKWSVNVCFFFFYVITVRILIEIIANSYSCLEMRFHNHSRVLTRLLKGTDKGTELITDF